LWECTNVETDTLRAPYPARGKLLPVYSEAPQGDILIARLADVKADVIDLGIGVSAPQGIVSALEPSAVERKSSSVS
jgi:hypothetical protein